MSIECSFDYVSLNEYSLPLSNVQFLIESDPLLPTSNQSNDLVEDKQVIY
jgi:hypothetical protein